MHVRGKIPCNLLVRSRPPLPPRDFSARSIRNLPFYGGARRDPDWASFWVANTSLLWPPGVSLGLTVLAIAQMGVHDASGKMIPPPIPLATTCSLDNGGFPCRQ